MLGFRASSRSLLQQIIDSLHNEFDITGLELLERAHMVHCNPSRTPVDTESRLGPEAKRQDNLFCSSAEAKYRGVANVVVEDVWLRNLLLLHVPSRYQYADMTSALFEDFRSSLSVRPPPT
uniref:Uncharacterized protein n=1 Tax=Tanacetum cinerariifolium TaxID=118510 RepID=A0A699HBZ8_TANCI|nr:hypothetical protein [Tanacetum cinerariifolium]